jgi:hypothetical protein
VNKNADDLLVLVAAPSGRDGDLICSLLGSHNISCKLFPSSYKARLGREGGAGVVILAEETLSLSEIDLWTAEVASQPSWSELFFILLTFPGERSRRRMLAL